MSEEDLQKYLKSNGFSPDGEYIAANRCEDTEIGATYSLKDICIICGKNVWIGPNLHPKWEDGTKSICVRCLLDYTDLDNEKKTALIRDVYEHKNYMKKKEK